VSQKYDVNANGYAYLMLTSGLSAQARAKILATKPGQEKYILVTFTNADGEEFTVRSPLSVSSKGTLQGRFSIKGTAVVVEGDARPTKGGVRSARVAQMEAAILATSEADEAPAE
jgi:hypothetical protein